MRFNAGFELRDVCGESVIVAHGEQNIDFSRIISLNSSAALLWKGLQDRDFTVETMADLLTAEYEVDRETALADASALAEEWIKIGLLSR